MRKDVNLRSTTLLFLICLFTIICSTSAFAGHAHYVPGAIGIKNSTLPPPGQYWITYNSFYTADTYKDDNGNTSSLMDMDIDVFANANQFAWVFDKQIFGAYLAVDLWITFTYTDINLDVAGTTVIDDSGWSMADLATTPLTLIWLGDKWDATAMVGVFLPTGQTDDDADSGTNYWTFMPQVGGTYYFDDAKSWTVSGRLRYSFSTEDTDTDITPGDEVYLDWGFGKEIPNGNGSFSFGLIGYDYYQVTEDSGSAASSLKSEAHAIGPEVNFTFFKPYFLNLSLRYTHEYAVENSTEGDTICLTLLGTF